MWKRACERRMPRRNTLWDEKEEEKHEKMKNVHKNCNAGEVSCRCKICQWRFSEIEGRGWWSEKHHQFTCKQEESLKKSMEEIKAEIKILAASNRSIKEQIDLPEEDSDYSDEESVDVKKSNKDEKRNRL